MNFQMYTFNSHDDVFFSNEILEKIERYYKNSNLEDITFVFLKYCNDRFVATKFEQVLNKAKTNNELYTSLEPKYIKWLFKKAREKNEYIIIIHNHIFINALHFSKSDFSLLHTYYKFFFKNYSEDNIKFFGSILVNFNEFTGICLYNNCTKNINFIKI